MQSRKLASIKARSAEIQVHAAVRDEAVPPRRGALISVQGWSVPAFLSLEEAASLAAALDDVAGRATDSDPSRGIEGPWTATIELAEGRRATVGFLGELQEGDRPEVFLSVSEEQKAAVTKEIVWLSPQAASELAREVVRAASA